MIPAIGELSVLMSKWDIKQQRKNKWKQERYEALDYYNGNTLEYTSKYFSASTLSKVVMGNVNITKRVIDRVSLVYMTPPLRTYTKEDIDKSNKNLTHMSDAFGYAITWEYPVIKPAIGVQDR